MTKYNNIAKLAKWILLICLLFLLATIISMPIFSNFREKFDLAGGNLQSGNMENKQHIINPKFFGKDDKGQIIEIIASDGVKQESENIIDLSNIAAKLTQFDGNIVVLKSINGKIYPEKEQIDLSDNVVLSFKNNYMNTSFAIIDIKEELIESDQKILIQNGLNILESEGIMVENKIKKITFLGPVKLTINE